jgi:hypothetical protein
MKYERKEMIDYSIFGTLTPSTSGSSALPLFTPAVSVGLAALGPVGILELLLVTFATMAPALPGARFPPYAALTAARI